jgi:hypothetical protein
MSTNTASGWMSMKGRVTMGIGSRVNQWNIVHRERVGVVSASRALATVVASSSYG